VGVKPGQKHHGRTQSGVFENRLTNNDIDSKLEKLHKEKFHNLSSSTRIVRLARSRGMRCVRIVDAK
jgi:hypothetical protein